MKHFSSVHTCKASKDAVNVGLPFMCPLLTCKDQKNKEARLELSMS